GTANVLSFHAGDRHSMRRVLAESWHLSRRAYLRRPARLESRARRRHWTERSHSLPRKGPRRRTHRRYAPAPRAFRVHRHPVVPWLRRHECRVLASHATVAATRSP